MLLGMLRVRHASTAYTLFYFMYLGILYQSLIVIGLKGGVKWTDKRKIHCVDDQMTG